MTARFGPSAASQQTVLTWLKAQGFTITGTYPDRLLIDVAGSAGAIDAAFDVNLTNYHSATVPAFYSNDRNPTLPAAIAPLVQNVVTNNYLVGHSNAIILHAPKATHGAAVTALPTGASIHGNGNPARMRRMVATDNRAKKGLGSPQFTNGYIDPNNLWSTNGYDVQALFNQGHCCNPTNNAGGTPAATSIDIVSACPATTSDLEAYWGYYGMAYNFNLIGVDGGPGANSNCANSNGGGGQETTLDAEQSVAMGNSYGSYQATPHLYVYEAPADGVFANGTPGLDSGTFFDLWNAAYSANNARAMSMSWGGAEAGWSGSDMTTGDTILTNMAGSGYSTMMAAGDSGAYENGTNHAANPQYPGSDPATTSVGGTQLSYYSNGTYYSESAWNSGGGGCSTYFTAWSYQTTNSFNSLCGGKRSQPDIALQSGCSGGEAFYFAGGWGGICGTSDAAPALAGITAQMNAYALSEGSICGSGGASACAPLGLLNWPIWYQGIAVNYASHQPFYDITSGNNDNGTGSGIYPTRTGYDLATGWGSVNALQLSWAIDWANTWDFSPPVVTFGGAGSGWYDSSARVSWTVADPKRGSDAAAAGDAGFSQAWDSDPGNPYHDATPGPDTDYFLNGPQFPNASSGYLDIPTSQGCHTVNVRSWDNIGQSIDATKSGLCYDSIAPVTTSITYGPTSPSKSSSVTIYGHASDAGCGTTGSCVDLIEYFVNTANNGTDSGDWDYLGDSAGASGSIAWNTGSYTDGTHAIAVDPVDNAGNFSDYYTGAAEQSSYVLDRVAPTTTLLLNGKAPTSGVYTYPVTARLVASDGAGSGVAGSFYNYFGPTYLTYTSPSFKIYWTGTHTIPVKYYSVDKATNAEVAHTTMVKVKPPAKTYSITQTIATKSSKALGSVVLSYIGLHCAAAKCVFKGIAPGAVVTFTETPTSPASRPFKHWVVNGKVGSKTPSINVTISKNTTVSAVY